MKAPSRIVWSLLATIGVLAATLAAFEATNWDLALQDHFFDRSRGAWIVDREAPLARGVFYEWPKYVIAAAGVGALALIIGPARWRARWNFARRNLAVMLLTLVFVPLLIGQLKDVTNVFCPRHLRHYGGDAPYVKVFEPYSPDDRPANRGHCFPAGHASGGFGLIGLYWLRRTRRWRIGAVVAAMTVGWAMGIYQMLNGAHFLSHTVTTMLIAIIITQLWRVLIREPESPPT